MDPPADSTSVADASASAPADAAATPVISFKKKGGAKRKEFRAPAQSLAANAAAGSAAAATPSSDSTAHAASAVPAEPAAVSIEDDTSNDADAPASTAPSSAASAAASTRRSAAADSDDSDDDDPSAPRASLAFSAADAARAAAEVQEEDPEDAADEAAAGGSINRPQKRAKKDNPLVQTTRNKLKKDLGLTIQSQRSTVPDTRTADKQITQEIDSSKVKRVEGKSKWSGPSKPQASNVRMISRFDYQPDVCKDYKETGRCGYGDSCKFMHDRGDYLAGWQVEKNWNEAQEAKRKRALQGLGEEEEENYEIKADEELPWACLICREPFTNPVVTKCKHYFCEKCALDYYTKDTKCFACRTQTHGIFNAANDLLAVIKKRSDTGVDKKSELEEEERLRQAAKQQATGQGWAMP